MSKKTESRIISDRRFLSTLIESIFANPILGAAGNRYQR